MIGVTVAQEKRTKSAVTKALNDFYRKLFWALRLGTCQRQIV